MAKKKEITLSFNQLPVTLLSGVIMAHMLTIPAKVNASFTEAQAYAHLLAVFADTNPDIIIGEVNKKVYCRVCDNHVSRVKEAIHKKIQGIIS